MNGRWAVAALWRRMWVKGQLQVLNCDSRVLNCTKTMGAHDAARDLVHLFA